MDDKSIDKPTVDLQPDKAKLDVTWHDVNEDDDGYTNRIEVVSLDTVLAVLYVGDNAYYFWWVINTESGKRLAKGECDDYGLAKKIARMAMLFAYNQQK